MPEECKLDEDNFYGDRDDEISEAKYKRSLITAGEGDTVTIIYTVSMRPDNSHTVTIIYTVSNETR